MLQELTDLDFDTYFDVASSNQQPPQQQPNPRDILYHGDQQQQQHPQHQPTSINALLNDNNAHNNRQLYPQYNQQQQSFDIFDWNLTPQPQTNTSPMQMSPISSPQSSSDGYTSNSLSPQMISSPPLYAFNQQIKDEASRALAGFFQKKPMFPSHLHNVPGINIPTTPITENGPSLPNSTNLPSPPLEDNPLSGAFSAIDQWGQLKDPNGIHPLDSSQHETRHWRKTSARHQQLQQSIPNALDPSRSFTEPGKQLKKVAHNAIERRYRNNINDRIRELKNVVPALYKARIREKGDEDDSSESGGEEGSEEIVDGVEVAKKLNKATILRKATEYIQFLKHTNDSTEQENLILQQIIAQMPGGNDVLTRFLCQKNEFEKSEQERMAQERREAQEREKTERQRILRERAAQRAALAQLLPKPERRPYRRRQSSKNSKSASKKVSPSEDGNGNKMFMAAFMCIAFFASSPTTSSSSPSSHHYNVHDNNQSIATANSRSLHSAASVSADYWKIIRYMFYTFGIIYICLIPLLLRWLRPRPINRPKKCLDHHHYANEVPTAWSRLYTNLISIVNKSSIVKRNTNNATPIDILTSIYDIIRYSLSLLVPRFLLAIFHKHAKPVGCPEELAYIGAWIRLNEVECLGANPDITRLGMLHSCVGMLAQLHKMKRDEKHIIYCEANTMARVYATTAMQLELCLPKSVSSYITPFCWKRVITAIKDQKQVVESDNQQQQVITHQWLSSNCLQQVLQILKVRNGFISSSNTNEANCRNIFYSFVLPYVTSPLDLVLYWQQLGNLQDSWYSYLNGTRPIFSEKQLTQVLSVSATTTAPGHMLQWWVRVGLALESLSHSNQQEHLDALAEYTRAKVPAVSHPSSNLLRRHQTMIYHLLEAATALQTNVNTDKVPHYLQKASKDRRASRECIEQIASTSSFSSSENYEASVLILSTLSVHLRTLKALVIHQQTTSTKAIAAQDKGKTLLASQASIYIAELRDQIMYDLESPYTRSLSAKCKKHIQSYIAQADDTLSL
ncbi:uncharacterized protein ATC70_000676 [Mucor velutinosus]|uniref:BHLH domain-containing protein n=1 Tax=Mucor velutinosus TaxID=708070 RepID=A0AAN7I1Q2_9FUNG|nr:hypothetical protein ATC70_000676 [Mucor velutinosus]